VSQFVARPRKRIDPDQVLKLACYGCPIEEIAADLDVDYDTLNKRFSELVKRGHQKGKRLIRSVLFAQAAKGNTAAAIFLCKAWLGMKEGPDVAINVSATATGGSIQFTEQTKKELEDFYVAIQRRTYTRVRKPEMAETPSGNGDQTALN
jgi:hypothetical protein